MNLIHILLPDSDRDLFFGPLLTDDEFTTFSDCDMADIAVIAGAFGGSKAQARKNGWHGPIPSGFSQRKLGKRTLTILNKWERSQDHES